MKKRVIQPDGTIIEIEGTAEEFAELERAGITESTQKNETPKKGPRILNEERVAEMIGEALAKHEQTQPHVQGYPWNHQPYPWQTVQPTWDLLYRPHQIWCNDIISFDTSNNSVQVDESGIQYTLKGDSTCLTKANLS